MQDNQREELIYLAGLFDGEGTICLQKDNRPCCDGNGKGWNPIYNVSVRIGMINEEAIRSYFNYFKVGYVDCEKVYHQFRPMYRWSCRAKDDVQLVLKLLMPHLRVKKQQAILGLRFYEEAPAQRGRFLTPECLAKREEFFLEMKKLNGIDYSPATTKRTGRQKSIKAVSDSLNLQVTVRGEVEVSLPPNGSVSES